LFAVVQIFAVQLFLLFPNRPITRSRRSPDLPGAIMAISRLLLAMSGTLAGRPDHHRICGQYH
jgi:hypothetical protein